MLLRDLTIENYRSFEKYKLDGLARVNLLVGDNNCGKTSVLEAVRLLTSFGDIGVLLDILEHREDMTYASTSDAEGAKEHYGASSLFWGGDSGQDPGELESILLSTSTGSPRSVRISVVQHSGTGGPAAELEVDVNDGASETNVGTIEMDWSGRIFGGWTGPTNWHLSAKNESSHVYIPAAGMATVHMAMTWRHLLKTKRESVAEDAMRVLHPTLERVQFSPDTQYRRDIFVDLNGERLTLAQLGGGSIALLSLGIALAAVKEGTLLVDEVDTGLHYSRLSDIWRMVIKTAAELDVQVFATTHSLDCMNGLQEAIVADPELAEHVAVHRIERSIDEAVTLRADEFVRAMYRESEIR